MKKSVKIISVILTLVLAIGAFVACTFDDPKGSNNEQVDETKTQLYVYTYNGGYGYDWLEKLKERFEVLHANDSYEAGKQGVQIIILPSDNQREATDPGTIKAGVEGSPEIYFGEAVPYRTLVNNNALLDISDIVRKVNTDGKTIESKLNDQQVEFLQVDGKYYGVPHYQGEYGLSYDMDLFDQKGFYFADGYDPEGDISDMFIRDSEDTKTAGPDCRYNTDDDGLPTTYQEFFWLCKYIDTSGCIPVSWTGEYYDQYTTYFLHSLTVDFEGKEQMMIHYTQDGTATHLGHVVNGNWVADSEPTVITSENAGEIRRQEGLYHALSFVNELFNGYNGHYHAVNSKVFGTYSHKDNQNDFLLSSKEQDKAIAMIIEGSWWEHEASLTFDNMATTYGSEYSMQNRRIGVMPLPKVDAGLVDGTSTHYDAMGAYVFIKKDIASYKVDVAKDFVMFANTDESLQEFSVITNTLKALNYEMSEENYNKLSVFGKTLYNNSKTAVTVYPFSTSYIYTQNSDSFKPSNYYIAANPWQADTSAVVLLNTKSGESNLIGELFDGIVSHYQNILSK